MSRPCACHLSARMAGHRRGAGDRPGRGRAHARGRRGPAGRGRQWGPRRARRARDASAGLPGARSRPGARRRAGAFAANARRAAARRWPGRACGTRGGEAGHAGRRGLARTPAGAAAALLGSSGTALGAPRTAGGMLPASVRSAGVPEPAVYDDPRLVRERATLPALAAVSNGASPVVLAGVGAGDRRRLGANDALASEPVSGAAEPLFALASAIEAGRVGPLIAVESASAAAVDVGEGSARVVRVARPALAPPRIADPQPARIPLSLPAYARAFDAKVGLRAARCACGALSYPPRSFCPACRTTGRSVPEPLPRACSVYTTSTIHTPVPGIPGPYSLAMVALDGVEARLLVHITGAPPGSVRSATRAAGLPPDRHARRRPRLRLRVPGRREGAAHETRRDRRRGDDALRRALRPGHQGPAADGGRRRAVASVDKGIEHSRDRGGLVRRAVHHATASRPASWPTRCGLLDIPVTRVENACATGNDAIRNARHGDRQRRVRRRAGGRRRQGRARRRRAPRSGTGWR